MISRYIILKWSRQIDEDTNEQIDDGRKPDRIVRLFAHSHLPWTISNSSSQTFTLNIFREIGSRWKTWTTFFNCLKSKHTRLSLSLFIYSSIWCSGFFFLSVRVFFSLCVFFFLFFSLSSLKNFVNQSIWQQQQMPRQIPQTDCSHCRVVVRTFTCVCVWERKFALLPTIMVFAVDARNG